MHLSKREKLMLIVNLHIKLQHMGTTYLNTSDWLGTSELSTDCSKYTTSDWLRTPKGFPEHKY